MSPAEAPAIVSWIGWGGDIAFAISGALLAARHRLDLIGFLFMANLTGVGGGTLRDLLLGVPVFWVQEPEHILLCSLAALGTWVAATQLQRLSRALLWADAAGISFFAVLGTQKALLAGASATIAVVMGVFTACMGGVLRDVVLDDPPIVVTREIYVTAILAGAASYVALAAARGPHDMLALLTGVFVVFALRGLAIARNLRLPPHPGIG